MKNRILRLNSLIKRELSRILLRELDLEAGTLLTIIEVLVSKDLQKALVRVSIFPSERANRTMKILQKKQGLLEHYLLKHLKIRFIPKLVFELDKSLEQAAAIEKLILDDKND